MVDSPISKNLTRHALAGRRHPVRADAQRRGGEGGDAVGERPATQDEHAVLERDWAGRRARAGRGGDRRGGKKCSHDQYGSRTETAL